MQARDKSLQKELEQGVIEEEKLNKLKSSTEQDLQIEKDKYDEAVNTALTYNLGPFPIFAFLISFLFSFLTIFLNKCLLRFI